MSINTHITAAVSYRGKRMKEALTQEETEVLRWTPEQHLCQAVIAQAMFDYFKGEHLQNAARTAREFLSSPDRLSPWCEPIGLDSLALSEAFEATRKSPRRTKDIRKLAYSKQVISRLERDQERGKDNLC